MRAAQEAAVTLGELGEAITPGTVREPAIGLPASSVF